MDDDDDGWISPVTTSGAFATCLIGRLYLYVAHVYFLVHEEHGCPSTLLPPILRIGSLIDSHGVHFCPVVLHPLPASLVDNSHEVSLAVVLVGLIWPVVICSLVEDNSG